MHFKIKMNKILLVRIHKFMLPVFVTNYFSYICSSSLSSSEYSFSSAQKIETTQCAAISSVPMCENFALNLELKSSKRFNNFLNCSVPIVFYSWLSLNFILSNVDNMLNYWFNSNKKKKSVCGLRETAHWMLFIERSRG